MHYIFDYELENLSAANAESSVNLAFFCGSVSAAVSLWATIFSGTFADPVKQILFITLAVLLSILGIFFFVKWRMDAKNAARQLEAIRETHQEVEVSH